MLSVVALFIMLVACAAQGAQPAALLEISPAEIHLIGPRDRVQAVLTAMIDGTAADVTGQAIWQSSDERVAKVDKSGAARAVGDGACQVTVSHCGSQLSMPVTVTGCAQPLPASFDQEVVPALTKAGCNSGKCHGSPSGKGGFALSLRGFDLARDFSRLTRECGSRRLNFLEPSASLLLAKPQVRLPHGGGRRLADDGPLADLLRDWIAAGAPRRADEQAPAELEIFPRERWLEPTVASQQLRVVARWPDGALRDVTHLAHFTASPEGQAEITPAGLVRRLQAGEVTIAAGFGPLYATSRLAFLPSAAGFAWPAPPENNEIDHLAFARLRQLRIVPADLADDATFLRRAWLDVGGVLPSPDVVRRFLADGSPDKRPRLIDELLDRPEYADFWAMKWSDRLGCNQRFVGKTGAIKYHAWIRHQVAANVPADVFAQRLLTASGGNYGNPPAGFYRLPRTPEDRGEQVAQVFLGVRIGCARCHNHPGERWTQDDYYGLAACFARLRYRDGPFFNHIYDKEETIVPTRSGELRHGRTGQVVEPQPLGSEPLAQGEGDRRQAFARWLTSPDNPFFARAAVNRIWAHLFGRGIVEPVDDFRSSNPPTHPELLDWLAADFSAHGFDRKRLIRQIMQSRLYQLAATAPLSAGEIGHATSSTAAADVISGDRYFAQAVPRLLGAEQLLDAIGQATGVPEKFAGFPSGLRAAELPDGEYQNRFLTAFGRPARALACACERDGDSNLGQALELVGGESTEAQLHSPEGRIARLCARSAGTAEPATDTGAMVDDLFLATLSRFPEEQERRELTERLSAAADRRAAAEDILWALINHPEFLFQH